MNAVNKAHLLAAQLLAHGLENVSLADVKASLACRAEMVTAAADMAVKVGMADGCQESYYGAKRIAYAVAKAAGLDPAARHEVMASIDARIDAAYA
jgi:hypothetical protein